MEPLRHPAFDRWLAAVAANEDLLEVYGEVLALLGALNTYGRELEDDSQEESHAVVTSRYDMHALRRTPPSTTAPYAEDPPVIRILYVWCETADDEIPVLLLGGDKTVLGNRWYPPNVQAAEYLLEDYVRHITHLSPIRRGRHQ